MQEAAAGAGPAELPPASPELEGTRELRGIALCPPRLQGGKETPRGRGSPGTAHEPGEPMRRPVLTSDPRSD